MAFVSLAFGDGSKTYPTGGIPLPDKSKFGMNQQIQFMALMPPANGYVYVYDKANHKLVIQYGDYDKGSDGPLIEVPNTHAPAATTLEALVIGE